MSVYASLGTSDHCLMKTVSVYFPTDQGHCGKIQVSRLGRDTTFFQTFLCILSVAVNLLSLRGFVERCELGNRSDFVRVWNILFSSLMCQPVAKLVHCSTPTVLWLGYINSRHIYPGLMLESKALNTENLKNAYNKAAKSCIKVLRKVHI